MGWLLLPFDVTIAGLYTVTLIFTMYTSLAVGVNFLYAATHEFGHSLGLSHSSVPESVMYPTYENGHPKDFGLTEDDIEGIQKLYGKNS